MISVAIPTITAKGIDFIADDGGLTTILSVQTVRLHEDTVRTLLEAALQKADMPPDSRQEIQKAITELPAAGLKHILTKLIDLGFSHGPEIYQSIRILQGMSF